MSDPFVLRPAEPNDIPFILDSWVRSYGRSPFASSEGQDYADIQDTIAKRLLERAAVLVCALAEDPETIIGWACTGPGVVHYVYVKHGKGGATWRRRGVASRLLAPYLGQQASYTHLPPVGIKVPGGWQYRTAAKYQTAA